MKIFYITGDTHIPIDIEKLNSKNFQDESLSKNDYLIICGDVGLTWFGRDDEDEYWQNWLNDRNFTTLFIDGNHENHAKLDAMPIETWNGGKIHKLKDSVIHLMRGQVYTIGNVKFFTFGGAESTDKVYRTENESWWEREMPSDSEYEKALYNLKNHSWNVDFVITHDAATEVIRDLAVFNMPNKIRNFFSVIDSQLSYKQWFFGHHHDDIVTDNRHTLVYEKIIELEGYELQEPIKDQTYEIIPEEEYYENNLPEYLQHDIDQLKIGLGENEVMRIDLYVNELQGSINGAYWDNQITEAQANYLRKKYL